MRAGKELHAACFVSCTMQQKPLATANKFNKLNNIKLQDLKTSFCKVKMWVLWPSLSTVHKAKWLKSNKFHSQPAPQYFLASITKLYPPSSLLPCLCESGCKQSQPFPCCQVCQCALNPLTLTSANLSICKILAFVLFLNSRMMRLQATSLFGHRLLCFCVLYSPVPLENK